MSRLQKQSALLHRHSEYRRLNLLRHCTAWTQAASLPQGQHCSLFLCLKARPRFSFLSPCYFLLCDSNERSDNKLDLTFKCVYADTRSYTVCLIDVRVIVFRVVTWSRRIGVSAHTVIFLLSIRSSPSESHPSIVHHLSIHLSSRAHPSIDFSSVCMRLFQAVRDWVGLPHVLWGFKCQWGEKGFGVLQISAAGPTGALRDWERKKENMIR